MPRFYKHFSNATLSLSFATLVTLSSPAIYAQTSTPATSAPKPPATAPAATSPAASPTRRWYSLPRRRTTATPSVAQPTATPNTAAQEEAQRQKDAALLKQQEADSQRAQQQQDAQAAAITRQQQKQASEVRVLDAPRQSGMTPIPVPETDQGPARIQDAPIPPPTTPPQAPPPQP